MWIRNSEYSRIFKAPHLIKVKSRDPNHMIDYQRVITQRSLIPVIYDVITLWSKMLSFSNSDPLLHSRMCPRLSVALQCVPQRCAIK